MNTLPAFAFGLTLSMCPAFPQAGDPNLPAVPFNYAAPELPEHFIVPSIFFPSVTSQDNAPVGNPVTDFGATLGRVLFYDAELSANGTTSCASCHHQELGFTDPTPKSPGFAGHFTERNASSLSNARYFTPGTFLWDEAGETLEDQVLLPIENVVEMGSTIEAMIESISSRPFYLPLYEDAFGSSDITDTRTAAALAQFIRSMESFQSRYDEGRAMVTEPTEPFPNFTDEENLGKTLFMSPAVNSGGSGAGCVACHTSEAFVMAPQGPFNNGLDANSVSDPGIGGVNGNPLDIGSFKAPSLRNIGVSGPYMHDGRLDSLEAVVEFYNSGIQPNPNLHPQLIGTDGAPVQLGLRPEDLDALVAFLHTLTDPVLLEEEKFSDPFPGPIVENYCGPAVINSSGESAEISAVGSFAVSDNDFILRTVHLPVGQFGMFLAAPEQAFVPNPGGSQGNLCLGGGTVGIGRLINSVQLASASGEMMHTLDLGNIPIALAPFVTSINAGMSWNFQTWFRDEGGHNNFSDGVRVHFQ